MRRTRGSCVDDPSLQLPTHEPQKPDCRNRGGQTTGRNPHEKGRNRTKFFSRIVVEQPAGTGLFA